MTETKKDIKLDYTTPEGKERLLAETTKTRAEVLKLEHEDERAAEKHKLDIQILRATSAMAKDQADVTRIAADSQRRVEKQVLADNRYHHVYTYSQAITPGSVRECQTVLTEWVRSNAVDNDGNKAEITIIFDSPGGSVIDGMHLWDFLQWVKSEGHKITTIAFGMAASMAGILLQAGDVRVMGRESYLLIHEVSFGAGGKIGEVEDEVKFVKKIQNRVLDIFADKAARALIGNGTRDQDYDVVFRERRRLFARNWERKDWWMDSVEALELGLIDEVR